MRIQKPKRPNIYVELFHTKRNTEICHAVFDLSFSAGLH